MAQYDRRDCLRAIGLGLSEALSPPQLLAQSTAEMLAHGIEIGRS
jgi:hypothetical protein